MDFDQRRDTVHDGLGRVDSTLAEQQFVEEVESARRKVRGSRRAPQRP